MLFKSFQDEISAFMERDPAARSRIEIILCYPGFHALVFHRIAHWLWQRNWKLLARFLSHVAKILSGIEIHPAATIGERFFIDHGTGVVIGETSVIGDNVTLYHDVTLGGISPAVDSHAQKHQKRHPTLEDNVIIGSGAQILGPITVGEGARVGANAVVTKDIPAGVTAVGIPARVVMPKDKKRAKEFVAYGTPAEGVPDPVLQTIEALRAQVKALMARVDQLEGRGKDAPAPGERVGPGDKSAHEPAAASGGKK